jgi:hypothetical protein
VVLAALQVQSFVVQLQCPSAPHIELAPQVPPWHPEQVGVPHSGQTGYGMPF